ncbi:hypothetical protein VPBG_00260 [Vibrio phage helene 12B3]|uniref:hypothetical protein n=1 Tax=Vibrio phage helene 12B3 TaxID=573173 RepID=UPI0002C0BA42|nr:hypothetical protein VPBG_00260 [Vibrio phage helene 12B3]AGG58032.1 hypothetical protein VPBG_00260 [Vibrio phage helene 12B3]
MKQQPHKHLLAYYTPQRCSAEDTQDLYLGFEELKPVLSILNKIQIIQKQIAIGGISFQEHCKLHLQIDPLLSDLEDLLCDDVKAQLEKEKK